jgi:hypothetical protein
MKFVQESAGNAQTTSSLCLDAAMSSIRRLMLSRSLASIAALTCVLMVPAASAHASDPLLSGYGGPGAGEQVVLGGKIKSSKSSSAPGQDPEAASLKVDTGAAATSGTSEPTATSGASGPSLTHKPQRKKSSSSSSKDSGDDRDRDEGAAKGGTTTTTTLPGAPEVVAYPTRADDAGGPISGPGVLLIVLGVAAATLVGLGLRRLSGFDRGSDPQVPGR